MNHPNDYFSLGCIFTLIASQCVVNNVNFQLNYPIINNNSEN